MQLVAELFDDADVGTVRFVCRAWRALVAGRSAQNFMLTAAVRGYAQLLLWAFRKGARWHQLTCAYAARYGQIEVLNMVIEIHMQLPYAVPKSEWPPSIRRYTTLVFSQEIYEYAIRGKRLESLAWINANLARRPSNMDWRMAGRVGDPEVLDWLWYIHSSTPINEVWAVYMGGFLAGQTSSLIWVTSRVPDKRVRAVFDFTQILVEMAGITDYGHVHVLEWLHKYALTCDKNYLTKRRAMLVQFAIRAGNMAVFKWVYQYLEHNHWKEHIIVWDTVCKLAFVYGRLDILQWLTDIRRWNPHMMKSWEYHIIIVSIEFGALSTAQYAWAHDIHIGKRIFKRAVASRRADIMEWYAETIGTPNNSILKSCYESSLGHLPTLRLLDKIGKGEPSDIELRLTWLAKLISQGPLGDFNTIEYMCMRDPRLLQDPDIFRCCAEYLDVIKFVWMLSHGLVVPKYKSIMKRGIHESIANHIVNPANYNSAVTKWARDWFPQGTLHLQIAGTKKSVVWDNYGL